MYIYIYIYTYIYIYVYTYIYIYIYMYIERVFSTTPIGCTKRLRSTTGSHKKSIRSTWQKKPG